MELGLGIFSVVVANLAAMGFYGFVLPFVITYTLAYVAVVKAGLSSDPKVAGVLALCAAFMIPLISLFNKPVGNFFVGLFGFGSIIIAIIFIAILIFAMLGLNIFK